MTLLPQQKERIALGPTASLQYLPDFISTEESHALIAKWTTELDWIRSEITLFGRKVPIPRMNTWHGDQPYTYSGTRFEAKPWTPELKQMKQKIEDYSGLRFNSVLVNWYRDGQDSMGWHSDNEASLGKTPQIASISLGQCRKFALREKKDKTNKRTIMLAGGSLLLMLGETQLLWQHSLPKTTKPMASRINLTFRLIDQQ